MPCKKCDGFGVFLIKVGTEIMVNKCEPCIFTARKPMAIGNKKIYSDSISFLEYEDQTQWELDHPHGLSDDNNLIRNNDDF